MPTYNIEGKNITTDQPLTDAEIDEIANSMIESGLVPERKGILGTAKDIAVSGFTQGLETMGKLGGYFDVGGSGVSGEERARRTAQEAKAIQQATGTDASQYETGALNQAMKAPFDFTNYVGAPLKGMGAVMNVLQSMGGAAGAEAARGQTGSVLASILGGIGGSFAAGLAPNVASFGKAVVDQKKQIPQIARSLSDKNTQDFVKTVINSDPSFKAKVGDFQDVVDTVSRLGSDLDLGEFKTASPFFYEALSNPAGRGYLEKAAKGDVAMQAILRKELENIKLLKDNAASKYGTGGANLPTEPTKTAIEKALDAQLKNAETKIDRSTKMLASKTSGVNTQELGQDIVNAIVEKEKAARALLTRRYEGLKKQRVEVGKDMINMMVDGYRPVEQKAMFESLSPTMRKAVEGLTNRESLDAEGVIELKNAIMKAKRTTKDPKQLAEIEEFASRFEDLRKSLPESFNNKLKKIDAQYSRDVAIPFVNDVTISSAKASDFKSDVVKAIIAKPESLDSLVEALGKDKAKSFITKATYYNAFDSAFDPTTGTINPDKLKRYVFKNREMLNKYPDLRDNLLKQSNDVKTFQGQIKAIEQERKDYLNTFANGYFDAVTAGRANTEKIVGGMLGNQSKFVTDQVFEDLRTRLPVSEANLVKQALKEELLSRIVNTNASLSDAIKKNEYAFKNVFGENFDDIQKMSKFFDKEKEIEAILNKVGSVEISVDPAKRATGIDLKYWFSQIRDRISSTPQKVVRLGTKAYESGIRDRTSEAIRDLFTDPESVKKVNKLLEEQIDNKIPVQKFVNDLGSIVSSHYYGSARAGIKEGIKSDGNKEDAKLDQEYKDILKRRGMK